MRNAVKAISLALPLVVLLVTPACQTLDTLTELGVGVGVATGTITDSQGTSINRTVSATGKAFEALTPLQEYYIGRAVAATILSQYPAYDNAKANYYLNEVGQTLAIASDKPETYAGYHFLIMDTDEVNAFAAPGGLILVSRGLLRCCRSEDAIAAVLAHEVGHIEHAHGLQAIRKSRITGALAILGAEGAKQLGSQEVAELTAAFEDSVSDVIGTMVNSGYARAFELEADHSAVTILSRVGYNPTGLIDMLEQMEKRMGAQESGFAKTHPAPAARIADIRPAVTLVRSLPAPPQRQARFDKAMRGI